MKDEDKITISLATLLKQTQDGTLIWKAADPPRELTMGNEDVIEIVYFSTKEDRKLRLFTFKTKYYYDEDAYHWINEIALEVSDESHQCWWRFPQHRIIWDLLDAVRFKTAKVEGFIDGLISESE